MIQLKDVSVSYGTEPNKTEALRRVNLTIPKGAMVAVVGKSGSGKTTLLKVIGALLLPNAGDIVIDGEKLYTQKEHELCLYRRRNVGFIYQSFNLLPELNVYENITFPLLLDGKQADRNKVIQLCDAVGIAALQNRFPDELSGGEKQRVAMVRSIVHTPKVLLCDEPTGNLDTVTSSVVVDALCLAHKRSGATTIVVTHDHDVAKRADYIATITDGCIESVMRQNDAVSGT